MIKAIAVDMDGTFLDSNHTYDRERFTRIYQELNEQDIKFIVASGSQYYRLKALFKGFDNVTYVAENGAAVIENDEVLDYTAFDTNLVNQVVDFLDERDDAEFILCGLDGAYMTPKLSGNFKDIVDNYYFRVHTVGSFQPLPHDILVKFALEVEKGHVEEVVNALQEEFGDQIHAVSSGFNFIDILHPSANKGVALSRTLKKWGIEPDEMIAFGDADNDVTMLEMTKNSYAMPHASTDALRAANYRAPSNEDNGVLSVLEEKLLN